MPFKRIKNYFRRKKQLRVSACNFMLAMKHAKKGYFVARDAWGYSADKYVYFENSQLLLSVDRTHAILYRPNENDVNTPDWYILARTTESKMKDLKRICNLWLAAAFKADLEHYFEDEIKQTRKVLEHDGTEMGNIPGQSGRTEGV